MRARPVTRLGFSPESGLYSNVDLPIAASDCQTVVATESSFLGGHFRGLTDDLLCIINFAGYFIELGAGWESTFGYAEEELLARPYTEFFAPEERDAFTLLITEPRQSDAVFTFETRFQCKDGSYKWLRWKARRVTKDGVVYAAALDLTRQKTLGEWIMQATSQSTSDRQSLGDINCALCRSDVAFAGMRAQFIQEEKLAAIGRLAAGIAHEVKNPLAVVRMGLDYIMSKKKPLHTGESARQELLTMRHAVERAESILGGLVRYSVPSELNMRPENLSQVVEQSLAMIRYEFLAGQIKVVRRFDKGMPQVKLDQGKIEQVLINVLLNAVQSMPSGGTLTVTTSVKRIPHPDRGVKTALLLGNFEAGESVAVIEVDDTGQGMQSECVSRAFEPFFTTKPPGKGTGLGLSVSRQIMNLHGGSITIENRQEGGVRVSIGFKL